MNSKTFYFSLLFALCSLLFVSGCTLPRIIILKDPLTAEEHLNLGVTYERQGDFENAIKEYQLAAPKLPRAYLYLGNAHFQKGEWEKAEGYYQKAIQKDSTAADAFNNLAWLYYTQRKNLDQAESLAQKALEINPAKQEIYLDTLEKIREAKKDLKK